MNQGTLTRCIYISKINLSDGRNNDIVLIDIINKFEDNFYFDFIECIKKLEGVL